MKLNEYGIFEYAKNGHSLGALLCPRLSEQSMNASDPWPSPAGSVVTVNVQPAALTIWPSCLSVTTAARRFLRADRC